MPTVIRRATRRDAPAIADLWIAMMREHQAFEERLALSKAARDGYLDYAEYHIDGPESVALVAEVDGEVVAYLLAYSVRNYPMFVPKYYGFISDVTVAADRRGQGLGRRLIARMEDEFRSRHITHIQLHVYVANERAREFWRRLGYLPYIEGRVKRL